jgi:PGF-CTERM protein
MSCAGSATLINPVVRGTRARYRPSSPPRAGSGAARRRGRSRGTGSPRGVHHEVPLVADGRDERRGGVEHDADEDGERWRAELDGSVDGEAVLARVPPDGTLPGDLGVAGTTTTPTQGGGGTTAGGVTTTATGGAGSGGTTASATTSSANGDGTTESGSPTGTAGGGDGDGSGTPGFGVVAALAAVLGAGALQRWRGED